MKFRNLIMAASMVGAFLMGTNAYAAGYMGSTTKTTAEGWACNPATPNYSGWVHFWRDDGKFLGALPANMQREPAVGSICGDAGVHGFQGDLDYPVEYLDNQWHVVRAYLINQDGATSLELQNSANVLFDGAPQPYVFNYQTTDACTPSSTFNNLPGWLQSDAPLYPNVYCPTQMAYLISFTYVYVGDPAIPVGSELDICAHPSTLAKIPAGWQVLSVVNTNSCIRSYSSVTVGNGKPSFYNITYYEKLRIRKVN